jgi:hypothetical protein
MFNIILEQKMLMEMRDEEGFARAYKRLILALYHSFPLLTLVSVDP